MAAELDPATYGLTIWDLDREFLTGGLGGSDTAMPLGEILRVLRDAYCRTIGIEYMHIQELDEKHWIQEQVEGRASSSSTSTTSATSSTGSTPPRRSRSSSAPSTSARSASASRAARAGIPILDAILELAADDELDGAVMGMAHRGRLNVLANIVGKSYDQMFKEFEGTVDPDRRSRARAT